MLTAFTWISITFLYLAPLLMLGLAGLAISSIFTFGGARRNALALLATGVFCAMSGAFYLYGFAASYYALQDNAYIGNAYLGLLLLLLGVCAFLPGGLRGAGLNRWAAIALTLVGLAGLVMVYRSTGLSSPYGGQIVVYYLLAALVVMVVALLALRRADLLGAALGLGILGTVIALILFAGPALLTGSHSLGVYLQFGVDQDESHKPPILEGLGAAMTILVAVGVFLLARRLGSSPSPAQRRSLRAA